MGSYVALMLLLCTELRIYKNKDDIPLTQSVVHKSMIYQPIYKIDLIYNIPSGSHPA